MINSSYPLISGFTFVRNGVKYAYPFKEAILSMIPICEEIIVNVGISEDQTLSEVEELQKKHPHQIKIIKSLWPLDDLSKKKDGLIFSEQTNIALKACQHAWCLYLQADEILHEKDYDAIKEAALKYFSVPEIEGLLFNYVHFYGSYDYIRYGRGAYRREVRMIRKDKGILNHGDAQSFIHQNGNKPKVALIPASIYHYGWVRPPEQMKAKVAFQDTLHHASPFTDGQEPLSGQNYRYKKIWGITTFKGTHPSVMKQLIEQKNWNWDYKGSSFEWKFSDIKKIILDLFELISGVRLFEYRPYRRVK